MKTLQSTLMLVVLLSAIAFGAPTESMLTLEDNFDTAHDYLVDGAAGTLWDGFQYNVAGGDCVATIAAATVDAETGAGNLILESTRGNWEHGDNDGLFLYKTIAGDFTAEMHVSGGDNVNYNDLTLMARVENDADAGPGEDYVQARHFFAQSMNGYRTVDDNTTFNSVALPGGLQAYLQLERIGDTFNFYRKENAGDAWTLFDTVERADMNGLPLQVGISQATYIDNVGSAEVDYVKIYSAIAAEFRAQNPSPEGLSGLDAEAVVLQWDKGNDPNYPTVPNPRIGQHYLYITDYITDGEPNFIYTTPITVADVVDPVTYDPGLSASDINKVYGWRVDESISGSSPDSPNTIKGYVWQFDTLVVPIITEHPENNSAWLTETASIDISASSTLPPSYQWYKSADNANNTPADDVAVGIDSDTLLLDPVVIADEGYYYCEVSNATGAVVSDTAIFGIKQKVAHWTLDSADFVAGQYQDISVNGYHATAYQAPSAFVAGANPATSNEAVDLSVDTDSAGITDAFVPAGIASEITLSMWLKWDGTAAYQALMNSEGVAGTNFWYEVRGDGFVEINAPGWSGAFTTPIILPVDEWANLVITVSPSYRVAYLDGEKIVTENANGSPLASHSVPLSLGDRLVGGSPSKPFNGVIDDARIYNFAMGDIEVAELYYEVSEKSVCLNPDGADLSYDLNGDCKIGLLDFAGFASTWLNCGLYPSCD